MLFEKVVCTNVQMSHLAVSAVSHYSADSDLFILQEKKNTPPPSSLAAGWVLEAFSIWHLVQQHTWVPDEEPTTTAAHTH